MFELLMLEPLEILLLGILLFVSLFFHIYFLCHVYNINGSYFVYFFSANLVATNLIVVKLTVRK